MTMKTKSKRTFKRYCTMIPLAIETVWLSGYYRFSLLKRPFSQIASKIGTEQFETERIPQNMAIIRNVNSAVTKVCTHTPWQSQCLVQALTAKKLLNKRSLPCTLYMGVAKDESNQLIAHAWLRCGNVYVTGGHNKDRFTVTGIYGDAKMITNQSM